MTDSTTPSLDSIRIAAPCRASWDAMAGDDRVRFCGDCRLHVYDFSRLRRDEIHDLLRRTEGRVCARLFRRADGTLLTRDCPVGLRQRARRAWARAAALLAAVVPASVGCGRRADSAHAPPPAPPARVETPPEPRATPPEPLPPAIMGEVMLPEPCPAPAGGATDTGATDTDGRSEPILGKVRATPR